jgi:hypothetical protein
MSFINSKIKRIIIDLCGSGHPNLYKFINFMKREESLASVKYFRAIQGYEPDKRRKKDIEKDLKIESLIQEVQDENIELLEYLSEVSKLFHFRINRKKD